MSALRYLGHTPLYLEDQPVTGEYVDLLGETYYRIRHFNRMRPFFMSLVSNSDHWLFVSSSGGLTAGRTNAENALLPYETVDKITTGTDHTGPKTILHVWRNDKIYLWEPFSARDENVYQTERHLYKNIYGNKLVFEAINHTLQLTFRYAWRTSDRFGFVKTAWLENTAANPCNVSLLDGLQNILPYGATTKLQTNLSYLLDAYKRNELEPETGLGIFNLSATITDLAEPSESLQATTVWQVGLNPVLHLLSSNQLNAFRAGQSLQPETDVKGRRAAYFVQTDLTLAPAETRSWHLVAEVNRDGADVVNLVRYLAGSSQDRITDLEADIETGTTELVNLVAAADGLQHSAAKTTTVHHFANVMFNVMRGGIFADGYQIDKTDLIDFVRTRNLPALQTYKTWFDALPDTLNLPDFQHQAESQANADLYRLALEYLPLTFSRRHGDPSRPWNRFSINLKHADGSPRLDYQGNWRDIFQNWEPLAYAFPATVEGMIAKFLNATTADGYNPYRVTRDGIEWEVPEPDDPWSNIGYWSDHQIIYLQKLLEFAAAAHPGNLQRLWNQPIFATANVPYKLRTYRQMLEDWYNTIDFDATQDEAIEAAVLEFGTDARLQRNTAGAVIHVTMVEKLLTLLLAKMTNFVPDGGIWMNTQRPEWNDANNALVGKGLSVVTVAYLRRFVAHCYAQLAENNAQTFALSQPVAALFVAVDTILTNMETHLETGFSPTDRRVMMDALGEVATTYRHEIYTNGISDDRVQLKRSELLDFLSRTQRYLETTLQANRRADNLYHAYNILALDDTRASIEYLAPMLEGQVSILSAGVLTPADALALLQALRHSSLYRPDQHTYILYPNKDLPQFMAKNFVPAAQVQNSALVRALAEADHRGVLHRDNAGDYHFNGTFRNAKDVATALDALSTDPAFTTLVNAERDFILNLFEKTFNHNAFTGRSGTFFGFEGLGSTYWHMVAKLLLAVQEVYFSAIDNHADDEIMAALEAAYYDIRQGLGFNKTPAEYGAFPTDPYSHTPADGGARQPGMTGQVKEEILTRWGELGIRIDNGKLRFAPTLLKETEFLTQPDKFIYVDINQDKQTLNLPANALAFTFCQIPIVYQLGHNSEINLVYANGKRETITGLQLETETTGHIFNRDGVVAQILVTINGI